jgi:hypothetical protein
MPGSDSIKISRPFEGAAEKSKNQAKVYKG